MSLTDASGNTVDLDGVEVITGSSGDDTLTVTDDTSVTLDGGDGADTLIGNVGDDTVGGEGSDVLIGGLDDGLPSLDSDVAVFSGSKGSYTFGVDELSGLLTVTSKETGSVDTVDEY